MADVTTIRAASRWLWRAGGPGGGGGGALGRRAPKINRGGGRDHHSRCFSVVMAGGGVRGGQVVGASDARGAEPAERPVKPEDLSATIYQCLGIDPTQSISSPEGVRVTLSRGGRPVEQALG